MQHYQSFPVRAFLLLACAVVTLCGCGTTRSSNTARTGTEQLLISDAIDRAVESINFEKLAGESVFFDEHHLYQVVDSGYLISSLRQHLLASGCILKDNREAATFIVEPRAGAIGTDSDELLFGIPATNMPQLTMLVGLPPSLPEVPIMKRRNQRGVAKIAVFAYRRDTGEPMWQSGIATTESTANDFWVLGAGPFKRGTIHKGTAYADGQRFLPPIGNSQDEGQRIAGIGQEALFNRTSTLPTQPTKPIPYMAKVIQPTPDTPMPAVVQPMTSGAPAQSTQGPAIFPPPLIGE